jgi:SAM-dependent methyltransferase
VIGRQENATLGARLRGLVPKSVSRALVRATCWPPVGSVRFGALRVLDPSARKLAGRTVEQALVSRFLDANAIDASARWSCVGDLARAWAEERGLRDLACELELDASERRRELDGVVCAGAFERVADPSEAVARLARRLRPGGRVVAALPGVGVGCPARAGASWGFTPASARRLFEAHFGALEISALGNVLCAIALVQELPVEALPAGALDSADADYPLLVGVRATLAPAV